MSRAIFAFSQISKVVITFAITVIPTMGRFQSAHPNKNPMPNDNCTCSTNEMPCWRCDRNGQKARGREWEWILLFSFYLIRIIFKMISRCQISLINVSIRLCRVHAPNAFIVAHLRGQAQPWNHLNVTRSSHLHCASMPHQHGMTLVGFRFFFLFRKTEEKTKSQEFQVENHKWNKILEIRSHSHIHCNAHRLRNTYAHTPGECRDSN